MATTAGQQYQSYRPQTGDSNRQFANSINYNEKSLPPSPMPPMPPPIDTKVATSRPPSKPTPQSANSADSVHSRKSSVSRKPIPSNSPVNERDFDHIRARLSMASVSDVVDSYASDSRIASADYSGTSSQRESDILVPPNRMSPEYQPMHSPVFRHEPLTHGPASHVQQPQSAVLSSGDSQRSSQGSYYEAQRGPGSRASSGSRGSAGSGQKGGHMHYQQQQPGEYFPQQQQQGGQHGRQQSNGFDFGLQNGQQNGGYQQPQQQHTQYQQAPPAAFPQNAYPPNAGPGTPRKSNSPTGSDDRGRHLAAPMPNYRRSPRPSSTYSQMSNSGSPHYRAPSAHSYDSRRSSMVDLSHQHQPHMPAIPFDNSHLQKTVGANATLLSNKKTLDLYRMNAKKTGDPNLQYELAIFMVQMAQAKESPGTSPHPGQSPTSDGTSKEQLLNEAYQILQSLSNKSPQAQYYLADAYTTGLFTKGKPDDKLAFPLFVSASKHGHPEAGYRAGLCYEFGWGSRRDYAKAVQFYRQAASKNHPGAMTRLGKACLNNDLGLENRYREGVKWLKRANDVADEQYPLAPYELGLLHEKGYGEDVFEDPVYAAQLFTKAASLGHADAAYRMGDAYEHGKLSCPKDAALSVHFYTQAAAQGHPSAMMALCAWYLVGAEPVLEKNEDEAYMWALRAAETGLPKAEYAVGYFTEMGIGCRRDALEANVWYVKAAEHGDERARKRLVTIKENALAEQGAEGKKGRKGKLEKKGAEKGECVLM